MRASDVDREAAVTLLRDHHTVGRLTPAEFNERMGAAYEAVTLGELARLISDLPPPDHLEADVEVIRARMAAEDARARAAAPPAFSPSPAPARPPARPVRKPAPPVAFDGRYEYLPVARQPDALSPGRSALRAAWTTLNAVTALNVVIWLLVAVAGPGVVYFWPVWVYGPAGAVLGSIQMIVWRHGRPPA
jgi:hypothetical protein